jgi:hypothetical protein
VDDGDVSLGHRSEQKNTSARRVCLGRRPAPA